MICTKHNTDINVVETVLNKEFWENHYSYWENTTFDFLFKYLNKDKIFIDIGSWIGPISLIACQHSESCICFEPDPIAYSEFIQNIAINGFRNIIAEPIAISPYDTISIGSSILGHSETRESYKNKSINCSCISISEMLRKYSLNESNISVLKMDVEGHESEIVQDRALWDINIPMHISLHPGWIDNKADYYDKIIPFLVHKGVDVSDIDRRGNFFDIQIDA